MVLPTWPKRLAFGSQNILSKHNTTLLRLPNPSLWIAATFQSGSGGQNCTEFGEPVGHTKVDCLSTPNGSVQRITSPRKQIEKEFDISLPIVLEDHHTIHSFLYILS